MKKSTLLTPLLAVSLFAGGAAGIAALASAQTASGTATSNTQGDWHKGIGPGVAGTVASVSGNTLTVTGKNGTTYDVDVTNAKIIKASQGAAPATVTISDIAVGDTVGVRGTVSGTSVTATEVMDGLFRGGIGPGGHNKGPGVAGTVSAVNGNTITVTKSDGSTYTVDASSAQVSKFSDISVSDIKVGDTVGVEGTVSGSSVTAKHIMDGMPMKPHNNSTTQTQ